MDVDDAPAFGGLAQHHRLGRHAIDGFILVLSGGAAFTGDPGEAPSAMPLRWVSFDGTAAAYAASAPAWCEAY